MLVLDKATFLKFNNCNYLLLSYLNKMLFTKISKIVSQLNQFEKLCALHSHFAWKGLESHSEMEQWLLNG